MEAARRLLRGAVKNLDIFLEAENVKTIALQAMGAGERTEADVLSDRQACAIYDPLYEKVRLGACRWWLGGKARRKGREHSCWASAGAAARGGCAAQPAPSCLPSVRRSPGRYSPASRCR